MKLKKFAALMVAGLVMGYSLTACEDDDEEDPISAKVAGTYSGTVTATVMGQAIGSNENLTLTIEQASHNTVNVTLPAFSYSGRGKTETIPALKIEGCNVTGGVGAYLVSKDTCELTAKNGDSDMNFKVTTLAGGFWDGEMKSFIYDVRPGSMPMNIHFSFDEK